MSNEHAPSYFADQGAEYTIQDYEELLGGDFGPDLPFEDTYDYGTGQDLANVESNGVEFQEPMASEAGNAEDTVRLAGEHESSQNDTSPLDVPGQTSYGTNEEAFGSPEHPNSGTAQPSFDGEDLPAAHLSEEDEIWREHEGLSDFQYGAGNNSQQQPPPNNVSAKFREIEALIANGGFPNIVDPGYQEPSSQVYVDNTFHPAPTRVDSWQPTTVNQRGMNSAHSATSISSGPPRAPAPTASNGLGTDIYNPRIGDMQGASDDRSPVVRTLENSAAVESVRVVVSDDENKEGKEEGNEDEDVPNDVYFETFEENDRTVVENPHRAGHGRTGMKNGHQVWFNPRTSKWQPSIPHHDVRETLIARAQAEYPNDRYLHPDPTDGLEHGETSFFKPHQNRGPDRQDCADILFEWRDYQPKKDENGKRIKAEKPKSTRKHPGFMYEGDSILLDPHDNPVLNHKTIPLTLSAHTIGAKLQEMISSNPDVHHVDLWARMPRYERMKNKATGNYEIVELRGKNTRINMPMTRFREKKGTIAGEDREGSDVIRDGLRNFYHQNGFDPVAAGNSTKSFWRDLEPWEVKEVRAGNAAKFGKRAGGRAIPEDKRQENLQKTQKSINNGKRRRAAENEDDTGNHPRIQSADHDKSSLGPGGSSVRGSLGASSRQVRGENASSSRTQRYGTHGAVQTPHQNPNPMAAYQQPQTQGYNNVYQPSYPGIGRETAAHLEPLQPTTQQGGQTWPAQSPYQTNGRLDTQRGPVQSIPWQPSANSTYVPGHILRQTRESGNDPMPSPASGYGFQDAYDNYAPPQSRRMRREQVADEAEYNPYVAEENRQRMLRQGKSDEFARANMVPNRPMSNTNVGYSFPSRPTVDQQTPFENTNGALRPSGNTLGSGGHQLYEAPDQVLGKRRQQGAGEATVPNQYHTSSIPAGYNGIQEGEAISQGIPDVDVGPSQKRQRKNGNAAPTPKPHHRRQGGKTAQPKRYGAGGAPEPRLLPEESSGALHSPIVITDDDAESPLMSPEELFRTIGPAFGFGGNQGAQGVHGAGQNVSAASLGSHGPTVHRNPSNGDGSRGFGPTTTLITTEYQGTNDTPEQQSAYLQHVPELYETHQILGKRRQAEPMEQPNQDIYVPQQNSAEQGPEEYNTNEREDKYGPGPKRRRIPPTGGYYSPPVQAPRPQALKKARNAERDAHLSPPQLNINETVPQISEAPQAVEASLAPPQLVILDDSDDNVEANDALPSPTEPGVDQTILTAEPSPQVVNAQGPDAPEEPTPADAEQDVSFDIRDVPPADGWEAQSLNNALNYTREAYFEWTGTDVPVTTNLEHSYNVQYGEIQAAFRNFWRSEGNSERLEPVPELYRMEAWSGGVEDWQVPEDIFDHLWPPIRRGRWAPRDADGLLQEAQHHWNAEKQNWCDAEVVGRFFV